MKENHDPHQVIISREYFDTLIEMARPKDYFAGTQNRPHQTMLARILRHARKFNRPLHNERQVEVETELVSKCMKRQRARRIAKDYMNKTVYVMDGDNDWPAVVHGEVYPSGVHLRLEVTRNGKCGFESVHIDDIIQVPRPL